MKKIVWGIILYSNVIHAQKSQNTYHERIQYSLVIYSQCYSNMIFLDRKTFTVSLINNR